MLISLCSAVMNRLDDIRRVMPSRIAEANASPPVEICVLDCSSTDGLQEYMDELVEVARLVPGSFITYKRIEGKRYWHMAKAYNMAILMGRGEYIAHLMADAHIHGGYVEFVRSLIADGCVWGRASHFCGNKFFKATEFIAAGGFDERFEFYGPEDKDLDFRLSLRGGKFGLIPNELIDEIYTPDEKKLRHYRLDEGKSLLSSRGRQYYEENKANNVRVANQGKEWGTWTS